jgi:hypothetical protein
MEEINSPARKAVREDLGTREQPLEFHLGDLYRCPRSEYVGEFPSEKDYDRVIDQDCDVFVGGEKVISFRKSLIPLLKDGSESQPEVWSFFRKASREVFGTQRGVVAGTVITTRPESRLTKGQVAFFVQSAAGLINTLEQAHELLNSSNELTVKNLKIRHVKKTFPLIEKALEPIEKQLRQKDLTKVEVETLRNQRRDLLWSWFSNWLTSEWLPSNNKSELTKEVMNNFISSQLNFNHCYSNVLGAIDRGARFPYGRLSGTTQRNYDQFKEYIDVYSAACEGFRACFPSTWFKVKQVISKAKDPVYNLFGTAFTSITLNFNFRTAYHVDKNNLHGGMAVLTVMTKGSYEGHYLVFPEVRLAFNLRDGDFIVGDTQTLLHGNTPMKKESADAERISMVFYSRENMIRLDDTECEKCRKDFTKFSAVNLRSKGKSHKDWNGVWPEMWISQEWLDFRRAKGLEHCSNSNWQLSSPFRHKETGEIKLFRESPGPDWQHLEVCTFT